MPLPWWESGEWQNINVGGDLESIWVPTNTVLWCGHGNAVYKHPGKGHPSGWKKEATVKPKTKTKPERKPEPEPKTTRAGKPKKIKNKPAKAEDEAGMPRSRRRRLAPRRSPKPKPKTPCKDQSPDPKEVLKGMDTKSAN